MTDNKIIKALESFIQDWIIGYYDDEEIIIADILSLINRQKAEIENLNRELRRAEYYLPQTTGRIGMTNKDLIKKFTDMLKDQFDRYGVDYTVYAIVDDVVREMESDSNAD